MQNPETRYMSTRRVRAFRRRQAAGHYRRTVDVTAAQLDALEWLGYLNPERRGDRFDEGDAIEAFLKHSLVKPSPSSAPVDLSPSVSGLEPAVI
jgi:hypothetical protein